VASEPDIESVPESFIGNENALSGISILEDFMRPLIILAAIALVATSALSARALQEDEELKPMPVVKLTDLEGKQISAESFKGNITIVDFWATWCGPCIAEIPAYNALQEKYASKGVKLVGVTMMSGEAKEVKQFIASLATKDKSKNMKYTVLMGDDDQGYDLKLMGFPTTFLVTKDWKIYRKFIGGGPRKLAQLEADIDKLLGEGN